MSTAHAVDLKSIFEKTSKSIEESIDKVFDHEDEPAQGQPPASDLPQASPPPSLSPSPQYAAAEMRETQRLLTELGYDPGPVDSVYGSKTLRAILAFETDRGLKPSGRPSASLLASLRLATGQPGLAIRPEDPPEASTPSVAGLPSGAGTAEAATAGTSTPEASSAAELGAQAGIPTWNGRLLVKGGSGISGIPTDDAITQMGHLAILLALEQFPDIVEDDQLAFAALELLEEPVQRQIITTAGIDAERIVGVHRYWQQLDEFERRALLQGIRGEAIPILRTRAPSLPIPILVLCSVAFGEYDFDSQHFPIGESAGRCESVRMNVGGYGEADLGNLHSLTIEAPLATEYLPDRVSVPLEDAQEYKRRNLRPTRLSQELAVFAVEARLVALKETEADRNVRKFEFVVDLEGALLFRPDDLATPFDRLELIPPSSVATVGASPTGPVPLDADTLNLMLLARELVALDDSDVARWAAERANREAFGREGSWPRFFPKEVAKELPFGRQAEPLLLANFAAWNLARARALPDTVVLATRTATLEWLQRDSQTGAAQAFDPPGSSRASTYRALAKRLGLPEARLVVPMGYDWSVRSQGLVGLGPVELVLVLPAARDEFRVALDQDIDAGGDFLDVSVAVRVNDLRIDRSEAGPTLVVLDVEPVAARVMARALGGAEVGSAAFDVPHSDVGRGSVAGDVEETPSTAAAEQAEAKKRAPQASEQRLAALLAGRTGLVMIRRVQTAEIETVYAGNSEAIGYTYVVKGNSLDLPAMPKVATTKGMAAALRDDPGVAIVVNASVFARDVFGLVADLDLEVSSFPPEEALTLHQDHAASLASLVPGDAKYVLLRRRDDQAPLTRVIAQDDGAGSVFYSSAMREAAPWTGHLEELGASIAFDLPEKAERVELREIPAVLRDESGAAVVLPREGLQSIYPEIADLDLVARRFPPEEFHVGIPKDHTEGAESFAILGISGGLDEAAALVAVNEIFASNEIAAAKPGTVRAVRGACEVPDPSAAGTQDEVGAYCLVVRSTDGAISHVALRQVVPGNAEEPALKALREKYRSPFTTEIRHLDRGAKRIVLGWGAPLSVDRASLGRVDAKTPPTVLEAVVWVANDVTTVLLHLDDVTTLAEVEAAQTPEIKF